jgi:hypothetical protein
MSEIKSGPEALKGEDWAAEMGAKWLGSCRRPLRDDFFSETWLSPT